MQSRSSISGHTAEPPRILVVEDERIVAADLAGALTELGYSVPATVATGQDAICCTHDLQPDLVLMDIRLSGAIDGIEAATSIWQESGTPVIYLTAHSDDETLRRAVQTDPVGYLVKPFTPAQLRCAIEIALRRGQISERVQERQQWLAQALHLMGATSEAEADAQLQRRVADRMVELEEANRELERFTYDVARDLRAPLQGIDGLSQSLIEDYSANLGPDGLRTLKQVRSTADRMRRVIDDLLLLSIDDLLLLSAVRKVEARREMVDLSALTSGIVEQLRAEAAHRSVKAVVEDDIRVLGDAALLRIALENLIGNAWLRTEAVESPRIEFGAIQRDGARVCFVRDNGIGLDMKGVNDQFVSVQCPSSEDPLQESDCLGLALVQRVIHKHGGRIWAEGAIGQGSTFYFSI